MKDFWDKKVERKGRTLFSELLPILFIPLAQKEFGISKEDFKAVQKSQSQHMAIFSFIASFVGLFTGIFFLALIGSGYWDSAHVNAYTWTSALTLTIGSSLAVIELGLTLFISKETPFLRIFGDIVFHITIALGALTLFLSDLKNGDLSDGLGISGAVCFLIPLILCQPGLFLEAIIFDVAAMCGFITVTVYGALVHGMLAVEFYSISIAFFIIGCYCAYSSYSYVEFQRFFIENSNAELLSRSTHDALTGARNRSGLRLYLEDRLRPWGERHENILAVMIDIDDFKLYNDTWGHPKGDEVLIAIANAIGTIENLHHLHIFRYGGEEFLIVISHFTEEHANEALEIIRKRVEDLHIKAPQGAPAEFVTISVGASLMQVGEDYQFHIHVQDADEALYEAKKSGKNCCVLRVHEPKEPVPESN